MIWVNGTLYDRGSLPPELTILFGTSLGLSPVCHLRERLLLVQHLDVLGRGAASLGYSSFDAGAAAEAVSSIDAPESMVALVPAPADHRAVSPGAQWTLVAGPFSSPDASKPLRLGVSRHRRNHHSPTINTLLLGDGELLAGSREATAADVDEVVWLNLDDNVSCAGSAALFAELDGRVVTSPLADGVPESAWRAACIDEIGAVELHLHVGELLAARSVACVWPWGSVQAVGAIDDTSYADTSLATRLTDSIATAGAR